VHGRARRSLRKTEVGRAYRSELRTRSAPCKATVGGRQCRQRAMIGHDYCWAHDPSRAEQREAILTEARQRVTLEDRLANLAAGRQRWVEKARARRGEQLPLTGMPAT
jgi:hypothetical protein